VSGKFSDFFIEDKNSPQQYTACVAVALFRTLVQCHLLVDVEDVKTKECWWKDKCEKCDEYNGCHGKVTGKNKRNDCQVPQEYIFDATKFTGTQRDDGNIHIGHCLRLIYRYEDNYKQYTRNQYTGFSASQAAIYERLKNEIWDTANRGKFNPVRVRIDMAVIETKLRIFITTIDASQNSIRI